MRKWNAELMFPTDNCFKNRILDFKFGESKSSGNAMLTLTCELVSPTSYEIEGEETDITGIKTTNYFVTKVFDGEDIDVEKTKKAMEFTSEMLHNLGIPWSEGDKKIVQLDWDNPKLEQLRGKLILTCMESRVEERRKTPTAKQIAEAKKTGKRVEGDLMKDPITGKVETRYWPQITKIYGPAKEGHVSASY